MPKSMSAQARQEMLMSIKEKYQSENWPTKKNLLDGFIAATGYERKYAIRLLNAKITPSHKENKKKGKPAYYDAAVMPVLEQLYYASNQICSKRLVPFIPELIAALERHGHLRIPEEIKSRVLTISPATLDRLLRKKSVNRKGSLSTTASGSLLKHQIKVRTFADWNEEKPGFFEVDLVAHCGETVTGVFLNTLVMTDIVTTWTECIALIRKSADDVILGLETAGQLLPFTVLGCDVDNGVEFINYDVMKYCEKNNITFTRSRAYKKNDQAHVEERNGSIVRRLIGYDRYETEAAWECICNLYAVLRLYINFFQPTLKLCEKKREGSRTLKRYEKAKTPYQRVLASNHIPQSVKDTLTQQYHQLDPLALIKQIKQLQNELWKQIWIGPILPAVDELQINPTDHSSSVVPDPRRYRKPKKILRKRDWRTRFDPFAKVQALIELELTLEPNIHAKSILEKLMQQYPDNFYQGHLRTLQRRVSEIRIQQNNREQKYQALMVSKKLMTTLPLIS